MGERVVWRFVALRDSRKYGIQKGDVVIATPGGKTRILRTLPSNAGFVLNLLMLDYLQEVDGTVGINAPIIDAMENAIDTPDAPQRDEDELPELRVVR